VIDGTLVAQMLQPMKGRAEPKVPAFEYNKRLAVCAGCQFFHKNRCVHIELGCGCAYQRMAWAPQGRCPEDKWASGREPWITTAELAAAAIELADQIPSDVTRIVGVPRSGMIPAATIAAKLHLPLFTIRDWQVVPAGGGFRMERVTNGDHGRWVFIDDTSHSGHALRQLRERGVVRDEHLTAVVFALDPSHTDIHHSRLPTPHLLEWHFFNSHLTSSVAFDMDGIICHNPPDGRKPLYLIRHTPARAIITGRTEKHRQSTERWLASYGVQYKRLEMWPGSDVERDSGDDLAQWKAEMVHACGAEFYVESEPGLADAIRRHGVRVLCPAQGYLG
jgi:hypothetical protein